MQRWVFLPSYLPGKRRIVGWWRALLPGEVVPTQSEPLSTKIHIYTVSSLQGLHCSALGVCLWACSSGFQHSEGALKACVWGTWAGDTSCAAVPACFPILAYGGCAVGYWGALGVLLPLHNRDVCRRQNQTQEMGNAAGFHHMDGVWYNGTCLGCSMRWRDLEGILGGECNTSLSGQNLRTRGSLQRAELVLSSPSQPAQVQMVAGRSGPNLGGAEVSLRDMKQAAEPLLLTWHTTWNIFMSHITC